MPGLVIHTGSLDGRSEKLTARNSANGIAENLGGRLGRGKKNNPVVKELGALARLLGFNPIDWPDARTADVASLGFSTAKPPGRASTRAMFSKAEPFA